MLMSYLAFLLQVKIRMWRIGMEGEKKNPMPSHIMPVRFYILQIFMAHLGNSTKGTLQKTGLQLIIYGSFGCGENGWRKP